MSLGGEYGSSFIGKTAITAFNGSAGANVTEQLVNVPATNGGFKKCSFAVRVTVQARVKQGGSTVSVVTDQGMLLRVGEVWRVDVEEGNGAYIAVRATGASGGDLEVTCVSTLDATDILP